MTHVKALQADSLASQGTSEPITPVLDQTLMNLASVVHSSKISKIDTITT